YLYTIRRDETGEVVFVVDSDPEDPGKIGEAYSGSAAAMTALDGTAAAEDAPYTDRWGTHMSAYAPIMLDGKTVGAAVVDLRYGWVLQEIRRSTVLVASLCAAFFVMSLLLLLYVTRLMDRNTQQLLEAKDRAEAGDRAKTAFFAQMSHEIRTPINAMCGMNEMILNESRTKQTDAETLQRIESYALQAADAGSELRAIMEDILDFAKLEDTGQHAEEGSTGEDAAGPADADNAADVTSADTAPYIAPDALILVVDDIEINLSVAEGLLAETQVRTDRALSGEEALGKTADTVYDLILMDQRMPVMNGTETLHAIRAQENGKNLHTPVICVTGDVLADARERYRADGFDDYAPKPLTGPVLRALVGRFLPEEKRLPAPEQQGTGAEAEGEGSLRARYAESGVLDFDEARRVLATDALITKTAAGFYEDIGPGADDLERFYAAGDIENYTIRVHALKSSSRMIGAVALSAQAQALEAMGNARAAQGADEKEVRRMDEANHEMLVSYRALAQTLRDVFGFAEEDDADDADKPEIDPEELRELYDGILEFAEIYDLDAIESLMKQAKEYRLPDAEKERFAELEHSVRASDWEALRTLLQQTIP
ncbi:MAG: response regulator, partial [Butyrivibrio sp.]|nr:response regulator [Butyrivibrio sp.]